MLTVVANLPYGPYGSSQFFFRKKAKLEEFLASKTVDCDTWQRYVALISKEQRIAEPRSKDGSETMFASLRDMPSFQSKGPLIKLLRWFSFFESMTFLSGASFGLQRWCSKHPSLAIQNPRPTQATTHCPMSTTLPLGPQYI